MSGQFDWSRKSAISIDSEWEVIGSVDPALQPGGSAVMKSSA